jgi:hypothetical protein
MSKEYVKKSCDVDTLFAQCIVTLHCYNFRSTYLWTSLDPHEFVDSYHHVQNFLFSNVAIFVEVVQRKRPSQSLICCTTK